MKSIRLIDYMIYIAYDTDYLISIPIREDTPDM